MYLVLIPVPCVRVCMCAHLFVCIVHRFFFLTYLRINYRHVVPLLEHLTVHIQNPGVFSFVTIVQLSKQEININTILLSNLQTLFQVF